MPAQRPGKPIPPGEEPEGADNASDVFLEKRPSHHPSSAPSPARPTASAHVGKNAIQFGPRARRLVRAVAKMFNPLVLAIAGRRFMPIVGKVQHRGRRSGRLYKAPLGVRPMGDDFVMPLTFSEAAHWYQNIRAAGWCVVTYRGTDHTVVGPVIVDGETALPAFPRYERLALRLLGIDEFVSLANAPRGWMPPAP